MRVSPNLIWLCPHEKKNLNTDTYMENIKAEIRVILLGAKEYQSLPTKTPGSKHRPYLIVLRRKSLVEISI